MSQPIKIQQKTWDRMKVYVKNESMGKFVSDVCDAWLDQQDVCLCGRPANPPHPCPFDEEVLGDDSNCSCCDACMSQCAENIWLVSTSQA